jgi:hypothetical protein
VGVNVCVGVLLGVNVRVRDGVRVMVGLGVKEGSRHTGAESTLSNAFCVLPF